MVAHRVVSPMLLGIKDNTGLGNNADELKTASILMDNTVIRPFQQLLLNAFDDILAYNKIVLNLYFKTLQPLEFNDLSNATNQEQIEEETGQKFSLKKIDGKEAYETIKKKQKTKLKRKDVKDITNTKKMVLFIICLASLTRKQVYQMKNLKMY